MKLRELAQIVAEGSIVTADEVLGTLTVVRGRDYWGDAEVGWLWENDQRSHRLFPDFDVDGPFMCLEYIGHVPISVLFFYSSLSEVESAILSEGGIFNPFTTVMCPIVDGQLRRFRCFYKDDEGLEHVFDKVPHVGFENRYPGRRLEWL